jgi:hypothetical protein
MKKINLTLQNSALFAFILGLLISCETDFASLDSDVINPDNATNFLTDVEDYPVITYNKNAGPVQTNGLPAYLLGHFYDPVYGSSTANIVSQMAPSTFDPSFGENVVLDSVVLTIPYFSTTTETDENGNAVYELDSIFGDTPIKFSVFKNNYFLRNFDPDSEFNASQKYFSNGSTSQSDFINPINLEGTLLYSDDAFLPSSEVIILTELDEDSGEMVESVKLTPGIRVLLDNPNDTFWQDLIFNKEGEPELSNQNNFVDHFRGLYIKTEATDMNGTMLMLNITAADSNITFYYTSEDVVDPDSGTEPEGSQHTLILNFTGNQVAVFDNDFISIPDGDQVNGDDNLYLKGGEGSMAVINLFNGDAEGNSAEFDQFKSDFKDGDTTKRLINEAYLEFYVDQTIVQGEEPNRLYLYDLNNNIQLIDYVLDQSVNATTSRLVHSEPLLRVDDAPDGEGIKYKIRITEHLNNIILRDSTNVKLGLVVTTNIGAINNFDVQNEDATLSTVPSGAILSPRGTVLHGNNTSDQDKRVTLKVYYTEPDN